MNEDFDILVEKLLRFKRKFYLNKLLRGLILSVTLLGVLFILINIFEYYSWSNVGVRTTIFYFFISATAVILGLQVFVPLFQILRMGKIISHQKAAQIIGEYFPEISDKLLNTLQLKSALKDTSNAQMDLLLAGIEQKTKELEPISFRKAVSFKSNLQYLKWLAIPLIFVFIALLVSPAFVTEPAKRLVNHKLEFEKPKPYEFIVTNDSLKSVQGENFNVTIKVEGDEYPEAVYLNDGKYDFRMLVNKDGILEHTFTKLKNDIYFTISTAEIVSKKFHLVVLPKPSILSFNIEMEFPSYLKRKKEFLESSGDIVVPEGTKVKWMFFVNNSVELVFNDGIDNRILSTKSDKRFEYSKTVNIDFPYFVYSRSVHGLVSDTLNYSLNVVKDEKPSISIENVRQEYLLSYAMVNGTIADDYGFSSLWFYYRINGNEKWNKVKIKIDKNLEKQNFQHSFNTSEIGLNAGDNLDFYYVVWDNDKVNGFKSSKTNILFFNLPTKKEIKKEADSTNDLMKSNYKKSIKDLDELSKELENVKKALFEKKEAEWNDREKVSELIKSEKELRENLQEMQELNSKREELKEFLQENPNQSIQEKLDKLTEQIEKLQQDELLEQLEKLSENVKELNKDQLDQLLDELKANQEDFKESLEQQLEFFKQLEVEQKLNETTKDLKELAKEEKKLADETKNKENDIKDAADQQEKLNENFEEIEKKISEIDSLNSNLEKPLDLDSSIEKQDSIKQDMQQSSENLEKGKRKKGSESQKKAAEKMNKMADQLSMMMEAAMQSRMGEDAQQVSKMLDNLLDISFGMENLISVIKLTSNNDPLFNTNTQNLKNLNDDYSVLHDSLMALSKRQIMLQQFLVKESSKVKMYFNSSLANIQERRSGKASSELQYAMTSANNLALMLEESLDNMKQSMNMPGSKSGEGECKQPGSGSKPGMKEMMKQQKGLGEGLKKAGKNKGKGDKPGSGGNGGQSQELARMAAQQSELRKQMQELMDQIEGEGGNGSALQKIIDKMEQQEQDIVNKRITSETIERQREIESRLLQADRALQEREKEERREAVEGKNKENRNPNIELKYKDMQIDDKNNVINSKPLKLSNPYKKLLKKYLYEIENNKKMN